MRILEVITDTDRRGAQVFAADLAAAQRDRGHAVELVALAPGSGAASLEATVLDDHWPAPSALARLRSAMRAADVVIAHGGASLPACALGGAGLRVPFVYRQISDPEVWSASLLRRARTGALLRRAARVIALSAHNGEQLRRHLRVDPSVIRVIPNAVPVDRFPLTEPADRPAARRRLGLVDRPTALFVGALSWEKGPEVAVDAMAGVANAGLVVVGHGPERAALQARADRVAPGRVVFLPPVDEIAPYLAAADLLVLTSRTEAMPAVVLEAALSGVPVVASPVGAIPDVLQHGAGGTLVDRPEADRFGAAVRAVLDDPVVARAAALRARRACIERHDLATVADDWERVLAEVMR